MLCAASASGACCRSGNYFEKEGAIPGACFHYVESAEGVGSCSDRSTENVYYTNACSVWPDGPQCLGDYPECTYRFERAEP